MTGRADHVLLVGGGHAQVAVLADWEKRGLPSSRATLLTPHRHLHYSGMVPGWIAGRYRRDEGLIDLAALARRAGAKLVLGRCAAIDPDRGHAVSDTGERIGFDIASLDTGGVGRAQRVVGTDPRLVDVRPIEGLVEVIARLRGANADQPRRVAVIGGGAGGVEIAFALRNIPGTERPAEILLVAGRDGLLPGFGRWTRSLVARELDRQDIGLICEDAEFEGSALRAGSELLEPLDLVVAALGSDAPQWPGAGGLSCDPQGFVLVDRHQRSVSHPHVFASGDMARRTDREVPHSGVHAVHAGPVLAANLRAAATGHKPTRIYHPRQASLYLLSTGNGRAIASYGPLAAQGRWVAALKHRIDTGWIAQYSSDLAGEP